MEKSCLYEYVMGKIEREYSKFYPNHTTTDLFTFALLNVVEDANKANNGKKLDASMVDEVNNVTDLFNRHNFNVSFAIKSFVNCFESREYCVTGRDLGFSIMQYAANNKAEKLGTPIYTYYFLELILESPSKLLNEVIKHSKQTGATSSVSNPTPINEEEVANQNEENFKASMDDLLDTPIVDEDYDDDDFSAISEENDEASALDEENSTVEEDIEDIEDVVEDVDERPTEEPFVARMSLAERFAALAKKEEERRKAEAEQASVNTDEYDNEEEKQDSKDKRADANHLVSTIYKVKKTQDKLLGTIFGQDHAISSFVSAYFQSELNTIIQDKRNKPRATFLFAGPPGVGKTFLAEQVAENLKLPFKRFDMSEYADKEAHLSFCGMDKTYKNSHAGNVTSFVKENKRSILLFDEIEKAHTNVIYLFLQILDAGRLRDTYLEEEIPFNDTIIIFTTNAGKQLYEDANVSDLSTVSRKSILNALATDINPSTGAPFFPRAICSRFASGNIIMFNHLSACDLIKIIEREFEKQEKGFLSKANIKIEMDSKIPYALLFAEGGKADARVIRGKASGFIFQELYELFRLSVSNKYKIDVKNIDCIKFGVKLADDEEEINALFEKKDKPQILVFTDDEFRSKITEELNGEVEVFYASTVEEGKEVLCSNNISIILCDVLSGRHYVDEYNLLNLEDVESEGRAFIDFINENFCIPYYLLERQDVAISQEEFLSFAKAGARGKITMFAENFKDNISVATEAIYQQFKLNQLAKANKVLNFNTSQYVSSDGKTAHIDLYGFNLKTAVDAEDNGSILSGMSKPDLRFSEIIGAKDAKEELSYFVKFLKDPVSYLRKGVKAPKGVLLYGPPGTGKTMLAKAMAGESDVTFLTAEGNQFLKKYVGEGSDKVHELFNTARKYAPSILFIDEIDAIAKNRNGGGLNGDASSDVLSSFLTEMDGFNSKSDKPVFVLAATNYDIEGDGTRTLDPALLRRFDRKILVDLPNKEERIQYVKLKVAKVQSIKLSDSQIENIAVRSTGMSLAELDNVFEYALRNSIKHNEDYVGDEAVENAFESYNSGEVKTWDESTLLRTARHEAGHALMCWLSGDKPSYLTIVARGNHGGYMQHGDNENKGIYLKDDLISRVRTALGGRAAEVVYYGEEDGISTGPSGDLITATRIVEQLICSYGMDEKIGLSSISIDRIANTPYYATVKNRVDEILLQEFNTTKETIEKCKKAIDNLVEVLLEKSHVKGDEIDEILSKSIKEI